MAQMTAARYTGSSGVEVVRRERPAPAAAEVIVRVRACGICGSDLHIFAREQVPALTPGHEFCGEVVEAPAGAGLPPGARVIVEPDVHCGDCLYCQMGRHNLCTRLQIMGVIGRDGGFAEYVAAPARLLFPMPEGMTWEQGALIEPLAVNVRAVGLAGVEMGDTVAVLGAGSIGLTAILAARAAGAARVVATAKYPHQAEAALRAGATDLVELPGQTLGAEVKRLTEGRGVDVVIDSIGADSETFADALASLRRGGTLALVGAFSAPVTLNMTQVMSREFRILGSVCHALRGHHHDFQRAIDLVAAGRVSLDALVTHRVPLADAPDAFRIAADKRSGALKVHILP
jgi:L-iditol 2-dehydrogenase